MNSNIDMKLVLAQLNQWCKVNNVSVQSVYDQCKGMTLEELVYYLFGVVRDAVDQFVVTQGEFDELYKFVHDYFDNLDVQEEINNTITELVDSGKLDVLLSKYIPFVTPQMFGAKGDGTSDDTDALSQAFNSGKIVIIPPGFYGITKTISVNSSAGLTIYTASKSVIKLLEGFTGNVGIELSIATGYSALGFSWKNGNIDGNNLPGITLLQINTNSPNCYIYDLRIFGVGNNGVGINIQHGSNKFYINNLFIYGGALRTDENGNVSLGTINLGNNNIGMKVSNTYDSSMGNIYCLGVTVGIYAENSEQIHVNSYHYWIGTDDDTNKIDYNQWLLTRAFSAPTSGVFWYFGEFYPDKPRFAIEGANIITEFTHYICPPIAIFENPPSEGVTCYLVNLTNLYGVTELNGVDVGWNDTRANFKAAYYNSYIPFRRHSFKIRWAYAKYYETGNYDPSMSISDSDISFPITTVENEWMILGWITCLQQSCHISVVGENNITASIDFDVITSGFNAIGNNAIRYRPSNNTTEVELALGTPIPTNIGSQYYIPVLYKTNVNETIFVSCKGNAPFVPDNSEQKTYSGNILRTITVNVIS